MIIVPVLAAVCDCTHQGLLGFALSLRVLTIEVGALGRSWVNVANQRVFEAEVLVVAE